MRKINLFLLAILFILFSCGQNQKARSSLRQLIDTTKTKFIADQKTKIFDIDIEEGKGGVVLKGETNSKKAYNYIDSTLQNSDLNMKNGIKLLPDTSLKSSRGLMNVTVGNMRSGPSFGNMMVTQALLGMPIKIYEKEEDWLHIQTPDGYLGWIPASSVTTKVPEELEDWKKEKKIIYKNHSGLVYKSRSYSAPTISDIVMGAILVLKESYPNWYKVQLPEGNIGYIPKEESEVVEDWFAENKPEEKSLVQFSKKFLGFPYLWGGTSAKAMDCSGFTKTVYFMHGVILQRDASQQAQYGKPISLSDNYSNLQPGDLLFFGEENITHVGMYIGDYEYIHSSGRVKINSLDESAENYKPEREESLVKARRIIGYTDSAGISMIRNNKYYK